MNVQDYSERRCVFPPFQFLPGLQHRLFNSCSGRVSLLCTSPSSSSSLWRQSQRAPKSVRIIPHPPQHPGLCTSTARYLQNSSTGVVGLRRRELLATRRRMKQTQNHFRPTEPLVPLGPRRRLQILIASVFCSLRTLSMAKFAPVNRITHMCPESFCRASQSKRSRNLIERVVRSRITHLLATLRKI